MLASLDMIAMLALHAICPSNNLCTLEVIYKVCTYSCLKKYLFSEQFRWPVQIISRPFLWVRSYSFVVQPCSCGWLRHSFGIKVSHPNLHLFYISVCIFFLLKYFLFLLIQWHPLGLFNVVWVSPPSIEIMTHVTWTVPLYTRVLGGTERLVHLIVMYLQRVVCQVIQPTALKHVLPIT